MLIGDSSLDGVRLPEVSLAPVDLADLELEEELLSVSVLTAIVTPLVEPVEAFPVAPSAYPEPPVPVPPDAALCATLRFSPLRVAADGPILDVFPPSHSIYDAVTSRLTPSLQEDADCRPPTSPATMDQYLSVEGDLLLGDTADLPMLSMLLMPLPVRGSGVVRGFPGWGACCCALRCDATLVSGGPL